MLEFAYNNGRGRVQLNLEMIIPCSAADMKRVLSFVNLSDDPDEHAKTIYDYIAGRVAELKKELVFTHTEETPSLPLAKAHTAQQLSMFDEVKPSVLGQLAAAKTTVKPPSSPVKKQEQSL